MKKSIFKKTAAFTAAVLMTASVGMAAMTASAEGESWIELDAQNPLADFEDSPSFNKTITLHNDVEGVNVYVPGVEYTYTVSPAQEADLTDVTDKNGNTVRAKVGVANGLKMAGDGTFSFSNAGEAVAVTTLDSENYYDGMYYATVTEEVPVEYDATVFESAGIYRYVITETSNDYTDFGITRSADEVTRFVDIYVQQSDDGESFEIYGAVMLYETPGDDGVTISTKKTDGFTESGAITGEKEDGEFTPTTEKETDPTVYIADQLYTYNYTVEKDIQNSLIGGETFPFTVTATGNNGNQFYNYSTAATDSADAAIAAALTKGTVGTPDNAVALGDGNFLALTAVPANVSIMVSEENTQTATYNVEAEDATKGEITVEATTISNGDNAAFTEAQAISDYASNTTSKPAQEITATLFTNKMVRISPTGLLFAIAPFAFMLAAAGMLIAVVVRSRKRDTEESMI